MRTNLLRGDLWAFFTAIVTCGLLPLRAEDTPNAVFVMRTDGGGVRGWRRLGPTVCHSYPRTGLAMAHTVGLRRALGGHEGPQVYGMNADGANCAEIAPHSMPDWSPDNKQFASQHFLGGTTAPEIFVQNLDGQGAELVGRGRSPRWSPDGGRLAVSDLNMVRTLDLVSGEEVSLFIARRTGL